MLSHICTGVFLQFICFIFIVTDSLISARLVPQRWHYRDMPCCLDFILVMGVHIQVLVLGHFIH